MSMENNHAFCFFKLRYWTAWTRDQNHWTTPKTWIPIKIWQSIYWKYRIIHGRRFARTPEIKLMGQEVRVVSNWWLSNRWREEDLSCDGSNNVVLPPDVELSVSTEDQSWSSQNRMYSLTCSWPLPCFGQLVRSGQVELLLRSLRWGEAVVGAKQCCCWGGFHLIGFCCRDWVVCRQLRCWACRSWCT